MRLAPVLNPKERATLAREMAEHVVKAAGPLPVVVVCDDEEVAKWADDLGARALLEPGLGLNGAINAAVAQLDAEGFVRLVVAHSDLPHASRLAWLADLDGIALVPDRRRRWHKRNQSAAELRLPFFIWPRFVLTAPGRSVPHRPQLDGNTRPRAGLGRGFPGRHCCAQPLTGFPHAKTVLVRTTNWRRPKAAEPGSKGTKPLRPRCTWEPWLPVALLLFGCP